MDAGFFHQSTDAEGDAGAHMFGGQVAGAVEIKNIVAQLINDRHGQHAARRDQGDGKIKTAAFLGVHAPSVTALLQDLTGQAGLVILAFGS